MKRYVRSSIQSNLDFGDIDYLRQFIKQYSGQDAPVLTGHNESGEAVRINVVDDNVDVETFQDNGRTRHNTYWIDGTSEEWFEE